MTSPSAPRFRTSFEKRADAATSPSEWGGKVRSERPGELAVALAADGLVPGPGDDRHLVDADAVLELDDALHHLRTGAGERIAPDARDALRVGRPQHLGGVVGREQGAEHAAVAVDAGEHARGEMVLRLLHGRRGECPDAEAAARRRMPRARPVG